MREWLVGVFVKKWLKRAVRLVVAKVATDQVVRLGVTVDPDVLAASVWTGLEAAASWAKVKTEGGRFAWLGRIL